MTVIAIDNGNDDNDGNRPNYDNNLIEIIQ